MTDINTVEDVEIVEVEDAVGHSKTDFLSRGMGVGRVWVELKDLDTMKSRLTKLTHL